MKSLYKDELRKVRKKHGLSLILLHGSRVAGSLHKQSDTDIAVVREKEMKKVDLLNLLSDLKKVFKVDNIDVVDLTYANPLLLFSVARKSKLLSGKKADYERLIRLAFNKYSDYLPYLENYDTQLIVERLLERITGRLIDINYYILKEEYQLLPEDYYDSFIEIGKKKVIPLDFADKIAECAGLRNALAHEYNRIDEALTARLPSTSSS